jgi:hypothetical protein
VLGWPGHGLEIGWSVHKMAVMYVGIGLTTD